jgi:hypothetical protein
VGFRYTYHDDPVIEEPEAPKYLSRSKIFVGLTIIAGFFLQTTLAANIGLSSNGATEFGQGVQQTIFCGGSSAVVTIKPISKFVNSSGAGTYYIEAIDVSGIPSQCNGVDFTIQAFDSSTSTALPLVNASTSDLVIYNDAGDFKPAVDGVTTTSTSGAFRATFTTPYAIPNTVYRFAVQTGKHSPSCFTGDAATACTPTSGIQYGTNGGSPTGYLTMSTGFSAGDTFTVEAWVKAANMTQENAVVILGAGPNTYALSVRNISASQWSVDMSGYARMNFDLPSGTTANNTWHFVVVVRDTDGISMWVNGTRLNYVTGSCGSSCVTTGSGTKFNRSYTTASTQIGAWANNNWYSKGGIMNYLRLSNVALFPSTQASITGQAGVPSSSASTKLLMVQASISPARDSSSLNQSLTQTGTVAVTN